MLLTWLQIIRAFIYKPEARVLLGDTDVVKLLKPELVWQLQAALQITQEQVSCRVHTVSLAARTLVPVLWVANSVRRNTILTAHGTSVVW